MGGLGHLLRHHISGLSHLAHLPLRESASQVDADTAVFLVIHVEAARLLTGNFLKGGVIFVRRPANFIGPVRTTLHLPNP